MIHLPHFHIKHPLEIPAMIASFVNVYLAARTNIWNWFFGAIGVLLYAFIFYQARLYGDMSLHGVYFLFQIYGFYAWKFGGKNGTELAVRQLPRYLYVVSLIIWTALFVLFEVLLSRYTNSTTPVIDAFITSLSLIAQWMMCKKWIENWFLWILMDIVSVYMCAYKGLYLTSTLYATFLIICCVGYQTWKRALSKL